MDLLGGYDSSSSSSSHDENDKDKVNPQEQSLGPKRMETISKVTATNVQILAGAATTRAGATAASKHKGQSSHSNKVNKKGKRLLKLQAVLPPHIWNQLVLSRQQQSQDQALEDDEDEDEDDIENDKGNVPKSPTATKSIKSIHRKSQTTTTTTAASTTMDPDMDSFLLELSKSATKASNNGNQNKRSSILQVRQDDDENDKDHDVITGQDPSTTTNNALGIAFVTSTVEVTRTKKNTASAVRSIHEESENENKNEKELTGTTTTANTEDGEDQKGREHKRIATPTTTSTATSHYPRVAAPSIRCDHPSYFSTTTTSTSGPSPSAPYAQYSYGTYANQPPQPQQHPQSQPPHSSTSSSSKSRKRQMEQMLRSGNLQGIHSDLELQGTVNAYELPNDPYEASASSSSHGVRVVPTLSYQVGTGQIVTSTKISGKQRGKNQLNALLASAASLEASRREGSTNNPQNIHRANAKRKYGW